MERGVTLKYMELSPSLNRTSYGFVNFPRKLIGEEFISYRNPLNKNFIVISNFGGTEDYECVGSCHCYSPNSKRRIASFIPSRGFYLLFSAVSINLAIRISEEAFRDECHQKMKDVCINPEEEISSKVHVCRRKDLPINPLRGHLGVVDDDDEADPIMDLIMNTEWPDPEISRVFTTFRCHASCLPSDLISNKVAARKPKHVVCDDLGVVGIVDIRNDKYKYHSQQLLAAKRKFKRYYLNSLCLHRGKDQFLDRKENRISYCVSALKGDKKLKHINCNVIPEDEEYTETIQYPEEGDDMDEWLENLDNRN